MFEKQVDLINNNMIYNTARTYVTKKLDDVLNINCLIEMPKVLFTYWDGNRISFMHYLTLYIVRKYHPDWYIILYMPKSYVYSKSWMTDGNKNMYCGPDYMDNILNLNIEIRLIDINILNINDNLSDTNKLDILRDYCISKHDGIWFDMDILWLNKFYLKCNANKDVNLLEKIKNSYGIQWYNDSAPTIEFIKKLYHYNIDILENTNIKNILYAEEYFSLEDHLHFKNLKKISIVMAYYNRKPQLWFTLKTIQNSSYKNLEIIIVDDCSDENHAIDDSIAKIFDLNIKIIKISRQEKTWINPCRAYNIGFKRASGDIIIIQNPEVCHIGDCISFILDKIRLGQWMTFNCYGLGNYKHNDILYDIYDNGINIFNQVNAKLINNIDRRGGNSAMGDGNVQGWLTHYPNFFTAYHYLAAIYKKDLMGKMNGGFCEDYQYGIAFDDNDFIKYLIHHNFEFVTTEFCNDKPFAIHQFHDKPQSLIDNPREKWDINSKVFQRRMAEIGANTFLDPHAGFDMPIPLVV